MNHTFGAGPLLRFGLMALLIGGPGVCWLARRDEASAYVYGMCLVGFICMYLAWPRAIRFDMDGIKQRDRLGRLKYIPWQEVDSLGHIPSEAKTIVGGGNIEIVHTLLHSDKDLFCQLIEERTGKQVFVSRL